MRKLNQLFPNHLKKIFLKVSFINYINWGIGIITSILTIRLMGASIFGKYQYCLALVEFPSVFYNSFDRIINRFISLEAKENHHKLVYCSLFIHTAISLSMLAFCYLLFHFSEIETLLFSSIANPEGRMILIFSLSINFFSGIFNTMTTYLSGVRKIEMSQIITMVGHLFGLVSLAIVFLMKSDQTDVIVWGLGIKVITLLLSILFVFYKFRTFFSKAFSAFLNPISNFEYLKYTIKEFFTTYAVHFQINEIFGHFKDRIGILILGYIGSFSNAAFYDILKNIISIPRKYFVQMFNVFIPKIIYSYSQDKEKFEQRFKYFCYFQTIISSFVALIIMLSIPLFIKIYSFENLKDYYVLAYFECLTLILTSWANNNNFSLEIKKDSKTLMQAGIGRGLIIGILSPILILKYEVIGASGALLISTIFLIVFLCIKTRADFLWKIKDNFNNLKIFLLFAFLLYFFIDYSFYLYKYLEIFLNEN